MKVIEVHEENHGLVCIATTRKAGWQYLVNHRWLTFGTEVWIFDSWASIADIFDDNGWNKTNEALVEWAMNRDEEVWDGQFYFSECDVYEED